MTQYPSPEQRAILHASMRAAYQAAKLNHEKALAKLQEAVADAKHTGDRLDQLLLVIPPGVIDK